MRRAGSPGPTRSPSPTEDDAAVSCTGTALDDPHIAQAVETLWRYHDLQHEPRPTDVGVGLGSHDLSVATTIAGLYHRGMFPLVVFTGANSPTTAERFPRGEAAHYREHAVSLGVPGGAILTEDAATNTGENITRTRDLLEPRPRRRVRHARFPPVPAATRLRHLPQALARSRADLRGHAAATRRVHRQHRRRSPRHQHARGGHPAHRDLRRARVRHPATHARRRPSGDGAPRQRGLHATAPVTGPDTVAACVFRLSLLVQGGA